MRILMSVFLICGLSVELYPQNNNNYEFEKRNSITIGILQGGGSLIGADFEALLSRQFGIQIGAGFVGFGAGLNYHLKPSIRSSFLSLQYWNQGIGASFAQNVIGGAFVFRGKKLLTGQLGLGFPLSKGPAMRDDYVQPPVMLLYSIGIYFPI